MSFKEIENLMTYHVLIKRVVPTFMQHGCYKKVFVITLSMVDQWYLDSLTLGTPLIVNGSMDYFIGCLKWE